MTIENDFMLAVGLLINFVGILYAVINSKVKLEKRLVTLETKVTMLMNHSNMHNKRSGD